ncbi:uncharacterized protein [Physcomitrium patens]|uniref:Uncharacterized protein n=1 Tax=Physcomitrium patens TaxID=3218 RepID=A0A2K1ITI2_PHYPA|nr:hypothetical protein PHYPA_024526 [Physcomitrium patens]
MALSISPSPTLPFSAEESFAWSFSFKSTESSSGENRDLCTKWHLRTSMQEYSKHHFHQREEFAAVGDEQKLFPESKNSAMETVVKHNKFHGVKVLATDRRIVPTGFSH